jgi:hypothetical protein
MRSMGMKATIMIAGEYRPTAAATKPSVAARL